MTNCLTRAYFPSVMNRWQHTGAFVIQFRDETDIATGRCAGRVEHVATSQGIRFDSLAELLDFIGRVLTDREPEPDGELVA